MASCVLIFSFNFSLSLMYWFNFSSVASCKKHDFCLSILLFQGVLETVTTEFIDSESFSLLQWPFILLSSLVFKNLLGVISDGFDVDLGF